MAERQVWTSGFRFLRKARTILSWSLTSIPISRRYIRLTQSRLRSAQSPASSITFLKTSFNALDTLRGMRSFRWSCYHGQYIILIILIIFSFSISQAPGIFNKICVSLLLALALLMPITRQFFLPLLPTLTWLLFFFNARFIPVEYRPRIWVAVLPSLENMLFGANVSKSLSANPHNALDILACIPYGLLHYSGPFLWALLLFIFAPPRTLPVFARTFGYFNILGVTIQLLFPCSPPWYENLYGLVFADYSIPGSPAGLARVDQLLGFDMYTTTFTSSPLVFGAFPSLHSGNAVLEALFICHCFPRLRYVGFIYGVWMGWATMYLSHHYAIDLVGGAVLAGISFQIAKKNFLPRMQMDKRTRWEYDYITVGENE